MRSFARFIVALYAWVLPALATAQELRATASLLPATTIVGEAVELRIEVEGSTRSDHPKIAIDGLEVSHQGSQSRSSFVFGTQGRSARSTVTHRYLLLPRREGVFEIPAQTIRADGQQTQTRPVTLTVQAPGATPAQPRAAQDGGGRIGWLEVTPLKKTAYVGEALPIEIRLLLHPAVEDIHVEANPTLGGEGFTNSKFAQPRREHARRGGNEHEVLAWRVTITPGKAGPMRIGPMELDFRAQVPVERRGRGGLEERLGLPLFQTSTVRQVRATADVMEIEVKPLPAGGKPASFSGAVGKFQLAAEGNPKRVKVGDPVTMQLTVSGEGNFERMDGPVLAEPAGWRAYEPAGRFVADDESGARGKKTFEIAVIPETKKSAMPVFAFSYFDPESEKYVTLKSAPEPLVVEGGDAPPAAAAVSAFPAASAARRAAPVAAGEPGLLGIRYDFGPARSWEPWYARRGFWLAQLAPLAVLLGLAVRHWAGRRSTDTAREVAALRREQGALLAALRREEERGRFFDGAVRALQIATALRTGQRADSVDEAAAAQAHPEHAALVREVFGARAEAVYAGGAGDLPEKISAAERERMLEGLRR